MAVEAPWEALKYSYVVDANKPYCLAKHTPIFDLEKGDVGLSPHGVMDGEIIWANSKKTTAEKLAAKLSVSGCYGAFQGAASMSVSGNNTTDVETVRVDTVTHFTKFTAQAGTWKLEPQSKLNPIAEKFFKEKSVEQILQDIGLFYATKASLGGVFQKTYVMEVTEEDNEKNLSAELEASYGSGFTSVNGKAGMEYTTRTTNKDAKMSVKWHSEGGNAAIWLKAEKDNLTAVKQEWSDSITDENLFVFGLELKPIWTLLEKVDKEKAAAMEALCMKNWAILQGAIEYLKVDTGDAAKKVVCRWAERGDLKEAGNDGGSHAKSDLAYHEFIQGDWHMLGHSFNNNPMRVVKLGPFVKKQTGWQEIWNDNGASKNEQDYAVFIPTCGDANFRALGVVCAFKTKKGTYPGPRSGMPVAMVHKDLCDPTNLLEEVWNDNGSGAKEDVALHHVPVTGTMWPSKCTMIGAPPQAYTLKREFMDEKSG